MFPTDQSHSYKAYPIADYESESTEISYTSLHKPNFSSKDSNTTPFTKESSLFAKESLSFVKEKQNPLYFSNIHKDSRRRNPFFTTKDEEDSEQGPSKRLCFENPYEYRAKTTSFVERRPEFTRENTWNVGNNTINFTNVNSLAHFQRKNTGINQKIQLFEHVKTEIPQEISFGKNARGLKNLSIKVREFVINHKETSYKEIAEQLLKEMKKGNHGIESAKEEQNIKRRIYDALNVLVATEIFKKRGKTVYYDGKSNVMGHDLMNKRVLVDKEALLAKIVIFYFFIYLFIFFFQIATKKRNYRFKTKNHTINAHKKPRNKKSPA